MSKKSSQKKRHTKPCRYFQVNKCPHAADVCDFAHVVAPPGIPIERSMTMCRFYAAGQCPNGPLCSYQHYDDARSSSSTDWATSPNDSTSSPIYGRYHTYGQVWPPSSFPTSTTNPTLPHFLPPVVESILFAAPPRSRESIDTVSTTFSNSNSSLDSDEMIVMTDDPQYPEHPHSHQSQVYIAEDSPVVHVPPFYPVGGVQVGPGGMISPVVGAGQFDWGMATALGNGGMKNAEPKMRNRAKTMTKQKAMAFKTKPCKFFVTERGCPNGSACSFIHGDERAAISAPSSPIKYPTLVDENDHKSYYPITWRVIGGGVRVGVAKEDDVQPPAYDPSTTPQHTGRPQLPPLKTITRQRSNSIPSTPSNVQVKVDQLFPAESPGVL